MAATFDFSKVSKSEKTFSLKAGDKTYSVLASGEIKLGDEVLAGDKLKLALKEFSSATKAVSATELKEAQHVEALRGAFAEIAKKHPSAEELKSVAGLFSAAGEIETALKSVAGNAAVDESVLAKLKKILVNHPDARNVLDAETHNKLHIDTFEKKVGEKVEKIRLVDFAKLDKQVTDLRASVDKLAELHTAGGYTEADVKKILAHAPAGIKDVIPEEIEKVFSEGVAAAKGKAKVASITLSSVAEKVAGEITDATKDARTIGQEIVTLSEQMAGSRFKSSYQTKLDAAGKKFADLVDKNPDIKHHIHEAMEVFSAEEKALIGNVKSASGAMKAISSAATSVAKDGGIFTKSAKDLTKYTAEELKGFSGFFRRRTVAGNVGIGLATAGGLYLIGSALAGTGNQGPGAKTNEASKGQGQGVALGA